MCADGSPYTYWIHQAIPARSSSILQGGGACFDPGTCAFDSGTYKVTAGPSDDPTTSHGDLRLHRPAQPARRLLVCVRSVLHRRSCTSARPPTSTVRSSPCSTRGSSTPPPRSTIWPRSSPTPNSSGRRRERRLGADPAVRRPGPRPVAECRRSGACRQLRRLSQRSRGRPRSSARCGEPKAPSRRGRKGRNPRLEPQRVVHTGQQARPRHHLRPPRLRVRRRTDDVLEARRASVRRTSSR